MKFLKLHRSRAFLCFAVILLCSVSLLSISARAEDNTGSVAHTLIGNGVNSGTVTTTSEMQDGMITNGSDQSLTNSNSGTITTTGSLALGMLLRENSVGTNNGSITSLGESSSGMSGVDSSTLINNGSIYALGHNSGGLRVSRGSTASNNGTITTEGRGSSGVYGFRSTINNSGTVTTQGMYTHGLMGNDSTMNNSGSITTQGAEAHGLRASRGTVNNSGISTAQGLAAHGLYAYQSTANNNGTLISEQSAGIYAYESTIINSGTIAGLAAGGQAITARDAQIYLKPGTNIQAGSVFGGAGSNVLHLVDSGTVNFNITGIANGWAEVHKSGVGTWTLAHNTGLDGAVNAFSLDGGTLALNSGTLLKVGTYTQVAGTTLDLKLNGDGVVPVTVNGLAIVTGKLAVDVDSKKIINDQTLIAAGSIVGNFDSVTSVNPSFSLTTRVDGNNIKLTTPSYAPKWDNTALSMTSTLASNMAFIQVPTARSQTLLTANDREEEDEYVMVASNGPLVDLVSQKPSKEQRYGVYAKPMFSISERDAFGSALGYDATMVGLEVGADTFVSDNLLLGAFAGYAATGIDFKGNAFAENDTEDQSIYVLGAYGGYRLNDWSFTDTLSFSYGQHDSKRNAGLGETAKGDYNSQLIGNQFLASYRGIGNDTWTLAPELGLNTSYFYRGSFSETDATNAATYDSLGALFIESEVGMRLSGNIVTESATFLPYVKLNWSHDLNGNDITVRQTLGATSAQVTQENDDDNLSLSLGTSIRKGNTSFNLAYTGEASQHSRSHSLSAIARYEF